MFSEQELSFLCDIFQKSRVGAVRITPNTAGREERTLPFPTDEQGFLLFLAGLAPRTVYKIGDAFRRSYLYLLLNHEGRRELLLIGPYLNKPLSDRELLEIGEKNGISPKSQRYLNESYAALPVLGETHPLFTVLDAFCERLWDTPTFAVTDVNLPTSDSPTTRSNDDGIDDTLLGMKTMEMRYQFENELMEAIAHGQLHKEKQLLPSVGELPFEKRVADSLRNAKNYDIIMNTISRKAAESAGVHPMHLNELSSAFAAKIEALSSPADNPALMREMFRAYCRLVRGHAHAEGHSPIVQKTILLIESNLSSDLSLATLAEPQSISPGYLSALFKKETGRTVSEYIRERRIHHAKHLLATTHLQIQTVALHCGIMDVQYFTKIFKKATGMTPRAYREAQRRPRA